MRRFSFLFIALLVGFCSSFAQKIEQKKPDLNDLISLLETKGYKLFAFDISGLSDSRYDMTFSIREYDNGQKIKDNILPWSHSFSNMTMLEDFSEESRSEILPEEMADAAKGIYRLANKITIGLAPENDSTKLVQLEVENMGAVMGRLGLRGQTDKDTGKIFYSYNTRPFELDSKIEFDTFIPLVLVGSVWFDPQFNIYRFCGENRISPDLSSQIVSYIPHFYVIGFKITPHGDK